MLVNVHAGQFGGDRFELAANLRGCVRLGVERLVLRGAAVGEQKDARLRLAEVRLGYLCSWRGLCGLESQKVVDADSKHAEPADL